LLVPRKKTCFASTAKNIYHRLAREVVVARENGSLGARRPATATARRPEYVPAASPAVAAVYSIGIRTDRCATDRSLCEFGSGDSVPSAPATALVDSAVRDLRRPLVSYPERREESRTREENTRVVTGTRETEIQNVQNIRIYKFY
jgi:hypothetical protein